VEPTSAPTLLSGWWIPDAAWAVLRLAAGLMLLRHGVQEHFGLLLPASEGWLGAPPLFTERWYAATIEIAGGALLALGLFTRFTAFVLLVLLALAHFFAQGPRGVWMPRGDELVVLLCCVLLVIAAIGPGMWSIDAMIQGWRSRSSLDTVNLSPWIRKQYRRRELTR
jgi:putative oxidoreductase